MLCSLIITVACLGQSKAPALPQQTIVEYLERLDVTAVNLNLEDFVNDSGNHLLAILYGHKGRGPQAGKEVILHIFRFGPHWVYQKSHSVQLMCGDDKLKPRKVKYQSEEGQKKLDDRFNEYIDIYFSINDLERILERDRDVEIEVGGRKTCTLKASTRSKILKFVKAVRAGAC